MLGNQKTNSTGVSVLTVSELLETNTATDGEDTLSGTDKADTIDGLGGDDWLYGLAGVDSLNGNTGNDTLDGGLGADTLIGGIGNDVFIYHATDKIASGGEGIDFIDATGSKSGVTISLSTKSYSSIEGIIGSNKNDKLTGAGGNDFIMGNDGSDVLDGQAGNDTLSGGANADTYQFGLGYGNDMIASSVSNLEDNVVFGKGITFKDIEMQRYSNDMIVSLKGNVLDSLTIKDGWQYESHIQRLQIGSSKKYQLWIAESANESLAGSKNIDFMYGSTGNDTLDGMSGADLLYGDLGNDYFIYDAKDTYVSGGDGFDTIDASDQKSAVSINLSTTKKYVGIEALVGGAGKDSLVGNAEDNLLKGNGGSDVLDGSAGNDTLLGGAVADKYIFGHGYGNDFIMQDDSNNADTIVFNKDVLVSEIDVKKLGNDLMFSLHNDVADKLTMLGWADKAEYQVGKLQVGTSIYKFQIGNDADVTMNGTSKADFLIGGNGNITLNGSTGSDVILGGSGNDTIVYDSGDKFLSGGDGTDILDASLQKSNVTINLTDNLKFQGIEGVVGGKGNDKLLGDDKNNILIGNEGSDSLSGGAGDDTLIGGSLNDTMQGGSGNDVYVVESGKDVILQSADTSNGNDLVIFGNGWVSNNITISAKNGDLVLNRSSASTDSLTIKGWYAQSNDDLRLNRFAFADGSMYYIQDNTWKIVETLGTDSDDIMSGVDRAEFIHGLLGNDILSGNGGSDTLYGDVGNDTLDGGLQNDVIVGGDGKDVLIYDDSDLPANVSGGNDIDVLTAIDTTHGVSINLENYSTIEDVVGSSFDDTVTGSSDSNLLIGGSGNDQLTGGLGIDSLYGGSGDDTINGGTAADVIDAGDGNDVIIYDAIDVAANVTGGRGSDLLTAENSVGGVNINLANYADIENLMGSSLDDTLHGTNDSNVLDGGSGNDLLSGGLGIDSLYGGNGNDTIIYDAADIASNVTGGSGSDWLTAENEVNGVNINLTSYVRIENIAGGGFDDTVVGSSDNNLLTGGSGNDLMSGGLGVDSLYAGSGDDTMDGGAGADIIDAGDGNDVIIYDAVDATTNVTGGSGSDLLTAESLASGVNINLTNYASVENVVGSVFDDTLYGSNDSNLLTGGYGNDLLSGGLGVDNLYGGNGNDTINGGADADIIDAGEGNDVIIYDAADEVANITGGSGSDLLTAESAINGVNINLNNYVSIENVNGSSFDDMLTGSSDSNLLTGGSGNDLLSGGLGADSLYGGNGNDTIIYDVGDLAANVFGGNGTDYLVATTAEYGLTVSLADYHEIENLVGSSFDDRLRGDNAANFIDGGLGNDSIWGSAGNDTLSGNDGQDVYNFNSDEGNDVILNAASIQNSADKVVFGNDVTIDMVAITKVGNDLVLIMHTGQDSINLKDWYTSDTNHINQFEFYDGNVYNIYNSTWITPIIGTSASDTLVGSSALDIISGMDGNDLIDGGSGNDIIDGGSGNDTIVYDVTDAPVNIKGGEGVDILDASRSVMGINVNLTSGYYEIENVLGGQSSNKIVGNSANNFLYGNSGNDTLSGGLGNDVMHGGDGGDLYIFGVGDGNDTISASGDSSYDMITFSGKSPMNYTILHSGNDLVLSSTNDSLTIEDWYASNRINVFNKTTSFIGDMRYIIVNDSWVYATFESDGADSISLFAAGSNQAICLLGGDDYISARGVNFIIDGGTGNDTISTNSGADTLMGGSGNDVLSASSGNDWIDGGEGNDLLTGGSGYDTYCFGLSSGMDTITSGSSNNLDSVLFGIGLTKDNVSFTVNGSNLVVSDSLGDSLVLAGWINGGDRLNQFRFADGSNLDSAAITEFILPIINGTTASETINGTTIAEKIYGYSGDDTINGLSGDDILYGGEGNDVINGGDGYDYVYGGDGDDSLVGSASLLGYSSDTLLGGSGDDTISGNHCAMSGDEGNDYLNYEGYGSLAFGGSGNDTLGARMNCTLRGGEGNDIYKINDCWNTVIDNFVGYGMDNGYDILQFVTQYGSGNVQNSFIYSQDISDLVMYTTSGTESIRVKNWFLGPEYQFEEIIFSDGVVLPASSIRT